MIRIAFLILLLTGTFISPAQEWELVTPVKTRSELPAVHMTGPMTGYMIDRVLGFVMKTTDAGMSWVRRPFNMLDKPKAMWMWNEDVGIIAANSGRFYRTTNGFETATSVYQPTWGNFASIHFVNDTLGWAGSESGKILRTTDGGATWVVQTTGITTAVMALHFVDELRGYAAATGSYLLRTVDGGASWQQLTPPGVVSIRGLHFFDPLNGIGVGISGHIIRTTDGGDTWTFETSPTTQSLLGLHVHGNVVLAMGNQGTILRSTNGGTTWNAQTLDLLDLYGASLFPGGTGLLVGKARVYRTLDGGATWAAVQTGTWHTRLNKVSFGTTEYGASAGWLTSGGFENGVIRTEDGGRHWINASTGASTWLGIHLRADGIGWVGGGQGANRHTTDNFATSTNHVGPSVAIRCTWAFSATTAIVGGGYVNGGCYRTTNGGSTWAYSSLGNIYELYFVNDLLGFCGGEGGSLHKTTDGGITWQQLSSPTSGDIYSIHFVNDSVGFIAGSGSGHRTTNGGQSWTSMGGVAQYTMGIHFTDTDTGYAVNNSGQVEMSTDGGASWNTIVSAPFDVLIGDATVVDGALIAVGRYGDVFRAPLACSLTPTVPTVIQTADLVCTGSQPGIQWYLNGTALLGDTLPCIEPVQAGDYTVQVTDALGCLSAFSAPVSILVTSVDEPVNVAPRHSPNPTSDQVTLIFSDATFRELVVFDMQGRVVQHVNGPDREVTVPMHALANGLYVIRDSAGSWAVRVVKE